jgi:hypothetical protein
LAKRLPLGRERELLPVGAEEQAPVDRRDFQTDELSSSARAALAAVPDAGVQASLASLGTPSSQGTTDHVARPGAEAVRYRVLRAHAKGGLGEVLGAADVTAAPSRARTCLARAP